ncbi:unnamed protein product [Cuscuta epithymum]|uniref:Uncharacterized protein n=2 Tax=Cuscuta epithymum TaxID=186058 RepID=A0AAV0CUZ2_9ASTE|nr:unnamed protein product [Cuscuta epithymum]
MGGESSTGVVRSTGLVIHFQCQSQKLVMSAASGESVNGPRFEISDRGKEIIVQLLEDRRRLEELKTHINQLRMEFDGGVEQKTAIYQAERERHKLTDKEGKKEDKLANEFDLSNEIIQDNDVLRSFVPEYFPQ